MRISRKSDSDYVWSQLLTEGMLILTDADCLEVVVAEVVESIDPHGYPCEMVAVTLASIDGTEFDRSYPMDYLVPTVPREVAEAA